MLYNIAHSPPAHPVAPRKTENPTALYCVELGGGSASVHSLLKPAASRKAREPYTTRVHLEALAIRSGGEKKKKGKGSAVRLAEGGH